MAKNNQNPSFLDSIAEPDFLTGRSCLCVAAINVFNADIDLEVNAQVNPISHDSPALHVDYQNLFDHVPLTYEVTTSFVNCLMFFFRQQTTTKAKELRLRIAQMIRVLALKTMLRPVLWYVFALVVGCCVVSLINAGYERRGEPSTDYLVHCFAAGCRDWRAGFHRAATVLLATQKQTARRDHSPADRHTVFSACPIICHAC